MSGESASRVRDAIVSNRERFLRLVDHVVEIADAERACAEIESAARFASLCGTGIYASSALEEKLRRIADAIECGQDACVSPSGILLVATKLYEVGGHTKVLERFCDMLAEDGERVSLFLTSPSDGCVPDALRESVHRSGGDIVVADNSSYVARARRLRLTASGYRCVLLMTHPEEVVHVLAFGTSRFGRPVFSYGHANHTFWLGVSVVDRLLEINAWGGDIATRLRGIPPERISVVGLPVERSKTQPSTRDRKVLFEMFGIPADRPIVVTAASPRKFRTVGDMDFSVVAEGILSSPAGVVLVVVGPDKAGTPEWDALRGRFPGRLICTGPLKYPDLLACYAAADVVMDSYPLNGWTSLVDAIAVGAAVVCPQGSMGLMDYLVDSPAYAKDAGSTVQKVLSLVADLSARRANANEMQRRMAASTDYGAVKRRLVSALGQETCHRIHQFAETANEEPTVQDLAIYAMTVRRKAKFSMPGISLCSVREGASKYRELSLFGGKLVWRL